MGELLRSFGLVFVELPRTQSHFFVWTLLEIASGKTKSVKEKRGVLFMSYLHMAFRFTFLSLKLLTFLLIHIYIVPVFWTQ